MRYVSGPHLHTKDSLVEELFAARSAGGRITSGETAEHARGRQKASSASFWKWTWPIKGLRAGLRSRFAGYWVKFFVDLSGDDKVAELQLDDALEAVAPFADECRLQTTD